MAQRGVDPKIPSLEAMMKERGANKSGANEVRERAGAKVVILMRRTN
jgi:hypothetical protein